MGGDRKKGFPQNQESFEGDKYVHYLLSVRVAGMYTDLKTDQRVHFKYGKFIVCQ